MRRRQPNVHVTDVSEDRIARTARNCKNKRERSSSDEMVYYSGLIGWKAKEKKKMLHFIKNAKF